jgi:hypothetical protein
MVEYDKIWAWTFSKATLFPEMGVLLRDTYTPDEAVAFTRDLLYDAIHNHVCLETKYYVLRMLSLQDKYWF